MSEAPLLVTRDGAIVRLTLNRPNAGNAIDIPMARFLMDAATEVDEDDSVRCVVLDAAGKAFCAGGDIASFNAESHRIGSYLKEITSYVHVATARLSRMNKPLLGVVNGAAAGAGLSLAILGDIVLAGRSASFTPAYPGVGLSPDGGATYLLPRLIGLRRAQEMTLLNQRVKAEEAAAMGLVTRVVDDDALKDEADKVAAQLAASATSALGATRRLLLDSYNTALETQLEAETRAIAVNGKSPHSREGVTAFLERRKPDFTK